MSIYTAGLRVFLRPLSCPKEEDCLKGTRKKIKGTALKKFVLTQQNDKLLSCFLYK